MILGAIIPIKLNPLYVFYLQDFANCSSACFFGPDCWVGSGCAPADSYCADLLDAPYSHEMDTQRFWVANSQSPSQRSLLKSGSAW